MHYSQQEKYELIQLVEQSDLGVVRTLRELKLNKTTFYNWYRAYSEGGYEALARKPSERKSSWNRINQVDRDKVVEIALEQPELSPRQVAWYITDTFSYYISESSVYRILKANGLISTPSFRIMSASDSFHDKTTHVNQMWQTDFTYFKIFGWGWYYLSTVLDDYSRFIVNWKLCSSMKAEDVKDTLDEAIVASDVAVNERPKLLSDNGSCYISIELADYLKVQNMKHIRGRPLHPQTQGKIERYHRSMKNVVKLDNYFSPEHLERKLNEFVYYYNYKRYHESLQNLTPADVYYGKSESKLKRRRATKSRTLKARKKQYQNLNLN